jgi:hypothetical protein
MLSAISMGFLLINQYMPDDFRYSDEEAVEMLAESVKRTFALSPPAGPQPDKKTKQEVSDTLSSYIDEILALRRNQEEE